MDKIILPVLKKIIEAPVDCAGKEFQKQFKNYVKIRENKYKNDPEKLEILKKRLQKLPEIEIFTQLEQLRPVNKP